MGSYEDYLKDGERFHQQMDELAATGAVAEWERRLAELSKKTGNSERVLRSARARFIKNALLLRPDLTEQEAADWADKASGLKDSSEITTRRL